MSQPAHASSPRLLGPCVALALALASPAGCGSSNNGPSPGPGPGPSNEGASMAGPGASAAPVAPVAPLAAPSGPRPSFPPPKELEALEKGVDAFSFDVWAQLRKGHAGNFACSPFSLATALTMTWAGAKGATADQMKKALHAEGTAADVLRATGAVIGNLERGPNTFRSVNRLFGEKSYPLEPGFTETMKLAAAPMEALDFKGAYEAARGRINGFVSQQTEGKIQDLIPQGGVDGDTRLVLVNALYLKAEWSNQFEAESTRPASFEVAKGNEKKVPTMHHTAHFRFAATDGVKLLEMGYTGGDFVMTFVLPDAVDGLDAVEGRLSPATFATWTGALKAEQVSVALPKFEVAPANALSMGDTLKALGMTAAFDRKGADFTLIANPPSADDRLFIAKVFHKAFVKVNEKGTEAAAASAVSMAKAGAAAPSEEPKEFKADHPFLFLLREPRSGMILFMGRVTDPTSKG